MNISELAKAAGVTADTLRYYEKQTLLDQPVRQGNGYRSYMDKDIQRVRFIRSAQTLGFSLAEIREIVPQLVSGKFGRNQIEQRLTVKIAQIEKHIRELRALKKELAATFDALTCRPNTSVSVVAATRAALPSRTRRPVQIKKLRRNY